MLITHFKLKVLLGCSLLLALTSYGIVPSGVDSLKDARRKMSFVIPARSLIVYDMRNVQVDDWTQLYRIPEHPTFNSILTSSKEKEILAQINDRRQKFGSDTLLTSDLFYVWKPYFDWLFYEDPHYRIEQMIPIDGRVYNKVSDFTKKLNTPAFNYLCVNDTIIINKSIDPLFKKGDMIMSINGVSMSEYLKYTYYDRYSSPNVLLRNYYYSHVVDNFAVRLKRDGYEIEIQTKGQQIDDVIFKLEQKEDYDIHVYKEEKCGYIRIQKFYSNNSRLINIVYSAIKDFKKQGCTNVILDLRTNPGGNDDALVDIMHHQSISRLLFKETLSSNNCANTKL